MFGDSADRLIEDAHNRMLGDVLFGEDVDDLLGEPVNPDMPTEHMSNREFSKYVDRLFEQYTGGSF